MYKLNRIEDTDIFYFAKSNVRCLGDTIVQGTFDEVLAVAEQLKNEAKDPGTESTTKIEGVNRTILELKSVWQRNRLISSRH